MRNTVNLFAHRSVPQAGFVLVMVLVLILLTGLSVAGFARKSLELASSVAEAQEALQRRWGIQSCRQLLLQNSEQLLDANVTESSGAVIPWPTPGFIQGAFELGGLRFEFRLSDEDAKINLNTLAQRDSDPLNRLTSATRLSGGPAGLTPLIRWPPRKTSSQEELPFRTWEQVFDLRNGGEAEELVDRLRQATGEITCWGSGKLNIRRASDRAVQTACQREVREETLRKLLTLRRIGGFQDLDVMLGQIVLKTPEAFALRRLLSTESKCHALWLTVRNTRRSWSSLTIDGSGTGNPAAYESFVW